MTQREKEMLTMMERDAWNKLMTVKQMCDEDSQDEQKQIHYWRAQSEWFGVMGVCELLLTEKERDALIYSSKERSEYK